MGLGIGISGPNGSEPCDDANVVNSDGTYDVDVAAGATLTLPDINNVDSDGSVVVTPAQTPFVASPALDANVTNSDSSYNQAVASGATLTLPDINNVDSDGSVVVTPAQTPFVASPALDANVTNSDSSYNQAVASGATLTLPDINNVDSDGSVVVTPAQTPFVATACGPAASVGATLMKTGQLVSYATGDDGGLQSGRAVDFFTLASNNPFGTTERFTDYLGGQSYSIGVLIDWSTYDGNTVLGYSGGTGINSFITWADAITLANNHSEGTFTSGWRLPNLREFVNVCNYNLNPPLAYSVWFNGSFGGVWARGAMWTSTTTPQFTGAALRARTDQGIFDRQTKTNTSAKDGFAVRTFTVNGTILT